MPTGRRLLRREVGDRGKRSRVCTDGDPACWWLDDVRVVDLVEDCQFPPEANDDFAVTTVDTPVTVDVLANDFDPDGDPLTVSAARRSSPGTDDGRPTRPSSLPRDR